MIRGLYTSASGMLVQQHNQDVTANNLANVNTNAFKKDQAVFQAFPDMLLSRINDISPAVPGPSAGPVNPAGRPVLLGRLGTGATLDEISTNFTAGMVTITDTPTDLAIVGEGFFVVDTPEGERYTRNGHFTFRNDGTLTTQEGYEVQGQNGSVVIPVGSDYTIDTEGRILVEGAQLDSLRFITYNDPVGPENAAAGIQAGPLEVGQPPALLKMGDSLYRINEAEGAPAIREMEIGEVQVRIGALERSNVNVIQEMVQMISASRAYEANQKSIQAQDGTLDKAVNELGRA
ncbi:flagellar hook-basal body protein [Heliorestis acidaminivorans]|uniref:Flagellar hook-basal body protein n=1 Tax=Heliorestis acidaminivorans TaxID=553427 RepID=A0A6I0F2Y7_9FIRM|nr:flagellar hook-basal body protein [Heliorestis acidaminivorans]KAB2953793.1 flagellar hook-basal body protein [Heliorestis acidaminivorans]